MSVLFGPQGFKFRERFSALCVGINGFVNK
jgi:hypothetical protein